jgi:YVTN family beta-propeller protein
MPSHRRFGALGHALVIVALLLPGVAFAQSFTIVTTPATDALSAIDLATNAVVTTAPLGGLPGGLAARGSRLFVALSDANSLAMIDLTNGAVTSLAVGANPTGVAIGDGALRVYVANAGDDSVSVVDPRKGTVVATIPVGDSPLDLVADDHRAYVANAGAGTVSVIDTASNSVLATIPVGTFPAGLAVHGRSKRLYVANFFDDTVSVIDTTSLSVVSTIPVARRPRGLALDTRGQRLFVAGFEDGRVQAVDTRTGRVTLDVLTGGKNPVALMLGPRETNLYVTHLQEHDGVVALDAATLIPTGSVDTPAGPVAFAGVLNKQPVLPSTSSVRATVNALVHGVTRFVRGAATATSINAASVAGDVEISDTEFNVADWAVTSTGEQITTQELSGGNLGAWRHTTHFSPPSEVLTIHRFVRAGSGYDPSVQGAIATIDASWDSRRGTDGDFVEESVVVEQGGVIYRTFERLVPFTTWTTSSHVGLVADDFSNSSGGHPDFSTAGGPFHVGYASHTLFGVTTLQHGLDNFLVIVHSGAPSSPGRFRFKEPFVTAEESDGVFVSVQRVGGTSGDVSVELHIERPDGTTDIETFSWPNGDGEERDTLILSLFLPDGSGASTVRLTLQNPTGGAEIDAAHASMAILVFPEQWPAILRALFLRVQVFLSAFSPGWLLLLAGPIAGAAWRSRRRRRNRAVAPVHD